MYRVWFISLLKTSLCTFRGLDSLLLQHHCQISIYLPKPCVIAGFRRCIKEITTFSEMLIGSYVPTFRDNLPVPSLRIILKPLAS